VAAHWLIVAVVAVVIHYRGALSRKRNRSQAGELWLRVLRRPVTEGKRRVIAWLLTAGVVLDGVLISVFVLPTVSLFELMTKG
jgi:hypothetical protein